MNITKKFNFTKSCLGYTGEDITYDEYLEEFKKTYENIEKWYKELLTSTINFYHWLKDEPNEKMYTKEEIQNKIKEFGLEMDIDGFNGEIKVDE